MNAARQLYTIHPQGGNSQDGCAGCLHTGVQQIERGFIMKMYLISDNVDTYTGMRLAGVDGVVVHERDELRNALEKVLADKTVGIVLLTEKFGREFPDIIDTFRLERKMPLLVEIPDRHGTGRKKDFITSYITEAIGLKL